MATNNSVNNRLGPSGSLVMSTAGAMTLAQQPCFLAYLGTTVTNVTGDGTNYTLICGGIVLDKASNYNGSTGVFTAPVGGSYLFNCGITLGAGTISTSTTFSAQLVTNNNTFTPININPAAASVAAGLSQNFSIVTSMSSSHTAYIVVTVSGLVGATVSIAGGAPILTYFGGALLN